MTLTCSYATQEAKPVIAFAEPSQCVSIHHRRFVPRRLSTCPQERFLSTTLRSKASAKHMKSHSHNSYSCLQMRILSSLEESEPSPAQSGVSDLQVSTATFRSLYGRQIPLWLHERLEGLGFVHPTAVQDAVLPAALPTSDSSPGSDMVIHAQTGSGKTLAYLIPVLAAIDPTRSSPQGLIVVPTQELGMQVYKLLRRIIATYSHQSFTDSDISDGVCDETCEADEDVAKTAGEKLSFPVLPMLDQANLRRQKLQLRQAAPRVIVGNPHRIAALVESGRLRLELLKVLVVDEFDACLLDTSTTNALQTILAVRGRKTQRQTILASATVPQHRHFLRQCVRERWTKPDIKHIWVEEDSGEQVPASLSHKFAFCDGRKKLAALRSLLLACGNNAAGEGSNMECRAIVFVMPSRHIEEIVEALNESLKRYFKSENTFVVGLSNAMSIVHRRNAMKRFRNADAQVLIATDVAARGLDFADISHVFHFDLPPDRDAYLHRAGRAGRLGKTGTSIVLISPSERFVIKRISNALGIEFSQATG